MERPAIGVVVIVGLLAAGCPREVSDPIRPTGTACGSTPDCNNGRTCGELRVCVDERCEADPTLVVPCP